MDVRSRPLKSVSPPRVEVEEPESEPWLRTYLRGWLLIGLYISPTVLLVAGLYLLLR
ncbi:MAG TPA: hypothetical protein VHR65_02415 [Solirubrobacterales bacterium]|nr:hypothetical protein [Solirubrobacterales bacterium]